MKWLRLYTEALDDPKVQRLPADLFKTWINLLLLAGQQEERGTLPDLDDIAFRLRLPEDEIRDHLTALIVAGLIEGGDVCSVHGWESRQPRSDNAAERMSARRRTCSEQSTNMLPLEESREEESRGEGENTAPEDIPEAPTTRASRKRTPTAMPEDWESGDRFAPLIAELGYAPKTVATLAANFRDHWISKGETRADWDASFRTWLRRETEFNGRRHQPKTNGLVF